jgi:hypothetical protein
MYQSTLFHFVCYKQLISIILDSDGPGTDESPSWSLLSLTSADVILSCRNFSFFSLHPKFLCLRSSLFWDVMLRRLVLTCRLFLLGQTDGPILSQAWPLLKGSIVCTETSVSNYQSTLCNSSEEQRSHLHRCGNLKSRIALLVDGSSA